MKQTPTDLRIIKTARTEEAINQAAANGYWPLVKPVVANPAIKSKYAILQDHKSGKIEVIHDYRSADSHSAMPTVIDFTFYYPHQFPRPFAAYLVPKDIEVNEIVWLEDLIEDVVGSRWNQGDSYRLKSCEAKWNGSEFILLYNEVGNKATVIG